MHTTIPRTRKAHSQQHSMIKLIACIKNTYHQSCYFNPFANVAIYTAQESKGFLTHVALSGLRLFLHLPILATFEGWHMYACCSSWRMPVRVTVQPANDIVDDKTPLWIASTRHSHGPRNIFCPCILPATVQNALHNTVLSPSEALWRCSCVLSFFT